MTTFYSRSDWLGKPHTAPRLKRTQEEIYIHFPAQSSDIGRESVAQTKGRLRGYWDFHVNGRGWSDIAYNYAVDQSGNVYSLRGRDRQCGGNGGTTTNRRGQAILVLVGNSEQPTQDAIEGVRWAIAHIQEKHPSADSILGHRDSFEASTVCPGATLYRMVHDGVFYGTKDGGAAPSGGSSVGPPVQADDDPHLLEEDSRFGTKTVARLQEFLISRGYDLGPEGADGKAGHSTWKGLQGYLSAPYVDGEISRQSYRADELGNGITQGWEFTGRRSDGSQTVDLLQKWVRVGRDGIWYEGTTLGLQRKLNVHARED